MNDYIYAGVAAFLLALWFGSAQNTRMWVEQMILESMVSILNV
jgi:hypothetical protein